MKLILSRHGNTFKSGETATWVGSRNDLPLVDTGINQANELAKALQDANCLINAIYCASLKRTNEYATIIAKKLKLEYLPIADDRLIELDYGDWSGLTNEQVINRFGKNALDKWTKDGVCPQNSHWGESEQQVIERVKSFADEIQVKHKNETVLAVTSNGILRYFVALVPEVFAQASQKSSLRVATGNVCIMQNLNGIWQLLCWNQKPDINTFTT